MNQNRLRIGNAGVHFQRGSAALLEDWVMMKRPGMMRE